ncbi:MAG: hypothetical protein LUI10_01315 [Lachnospiraceae bacterium]|nr:hypothetical protein [Lachnospiraceae bacterium]
MKIWKRTISVIAVVLACYGFFSVCLPEMNFLRGTCEVISGGEALSSAELYEKALRGEVSLQYGSRLWEWFQNMTER